MAEESWRLKLHRAEEHCLDLTERLAPYGLSKN